MKTFFKKAEYVLLTLFVVFLSQVPFIYEKLIISGKGFSARTTIVDAFICLLIVFYSLRMAKKEGLLSLDFSFFNWGAVGKLAISYFLSLPLGIIVLAVKRVEGAPKVTSNQAALEELFKHMPMILILFGVILVAPVLEEIVFRGLIPQKLFPKHQILGMAIGTVLFGLFHSPNNLSSFIFYAGMGAILAWVAYSSKRLEMSILAHALRNGVTFLLYWL